MNNHGRTASRAGLLTLLLAPIVALTMLATMPRTARATDAGPQLSEAEAAIVCNQNGTVLWSLNPDMQLPPASITKVMTAMLALDSGLSLDTPVTVVEEQPGGNSQTAGYEPGDTTTLRDLLLATLVYSGNDAAINVASIVAGDVDSFVAMMNKRAKELGMSHTHFANPHGLDDPNHYSSVSDLVIMGRYALENYPFIASAVRNRAVELDIGGELTTLESTDELMDVYDGLLGIKTGAVESGTGFLGASKRDGVTLYTVVLGCPTSDGRFNDTATLMDWVYDQAYRWRSGAGEGFTLRMVPSSLGFSRRAVRAPWHMGPYVLPVGDVTESSVRSGAHLMLDANEPLASLYWRQEGRMAGADALVASEETYRTPSLNPFALPLFDGAFTQTAA